MEPDTSERSEQQPRDASFLAALRSQPAVALVGLLSVLVLVLVVALSSR